MYKKFFAPTVIILVLMINLFLGLTRLKNYSAVDEPYWTYDRTPQFWTAIKKMDWRKTDVNDKPGITVAILSGGGLAKYNPLAFKQLRDRPKTEAQLTAINDINFYFRLPIFLFIIALLPLFYFFLRKLFGQTIALLAFVMIGFSPILLGISLIINPDSLLWLFMPFSLLTYFIFLKDGERRYLFASGIFLGLSLLTKYVSNLLIIFYLLLPFAEYSFMQSKKELSAYLKQGLKDYFILLFFATATYFALFPATWINWRKLLAGTFLSKAFETTWPIFVVFFAAIILDWLLLKSKVVGWILQKISHWQKIIISSVALLFVLLAAFAMLDTYFGMKPFEISDILASPKNSESNPLLALKSLGNIVADVYSLIFGIAPLALLGFFFALFSLIKHNRKNTFSRRDLTVLYFISLIILYYLASTVNHVVATVRYQIVLYPFAFIIAAIGIYEILIFFKLNKEKHKVVAIILTAFFSLAGVLAMRPHYFTYASSLLPKQYVLNLKGMGDGSYEAAQYLNSLPDAENLKVWSDKGAVCAVFTGKCFTGYDGKEIKNTTFDYYVVSTDRESKFSRRLDFNEAYEAKNADFIVTLGNRPDNYVKVVATEKLKK